MGRKIWANAMMSSMRNRVSLFSSTETFNEATMNFIFLVSYQIFFEILSGFKFQVNVIKKNEPCDINVITSV